MSSNKTAQLALGELNDAGGRTKSRYRSSKILPPVILFIVVCVMWQYAPGLLGVPRYILPALSDVFAAFLSVDNLRLYAMHGGVTLAEALIGLAIGTAAGFILGVVLAEMPRVHNTVYPYVIAIQSLPKVAIAPLFVIWLGFGIESKILIVLLLAFFPVLVNTITGVRSVDSDSLELFRSIGASRLVTMRKLVIPSAMPSFFAGFEVAVVTSLLGAIVGEFVGAQAGLGVLILQAQFRMDIASVFSVLIVLVVMGVSLNLLVRYLRKRALFWQPREK